MSGWFPSRRPLTSGSHVHLSAQLRPGGAGQNGPLPALAWPLPLPGMLRGHLFGGPSRSPSKGGLPPHRYSPPGVLSPVLSARVPPPEASGMCIPCLSAPLPPEGKGPVSRAWARLLFPHVPGTTSKCYTKERQRFQRVCFSPSNARRGAKISVVVREWLLLSGWGPCPSPLAFSWRLGGYSNSSPAAHTWHCHQLPNLSTSGP